MIVTIPGVTTIGGIAFDDVTLDQEADVLYLWSGASRAPDGDDASPEGHYVQFGPHGEVIAITIVNARGMLEREGKLVMTLPDGSRLEASGLCSRRSAFVQDVHGWSSLVGRGCASPPTTTVSPAGPGRASSVRMARAGLEPATPRFSAVCSTN